MSLLSLLVAWFVGLYATRQLRERRAPPPWLFRRVDAIVARAGWSFWLVWATLSVLNYVPPSENWKGLATGEESVGLFALGLFSTATINIVCFYTFLSGRQEGVRGARLLLLVPILLSAVLGVAGGSRGASFAALSLAFTYWLFLHSEERPGRRAIPKFILAMSILPVLTYGALLAQTLRPLFRLSSGDEELSAAISDSLRLSNPDNPVVSTLYFGLTQFLHRMSSLDAQFAILNQHWVHNPWETFNPVRLLMGTINGLLPSGLKPFSDLLSINQLFDYIYRDDMVHYSSTMWSIQGSLYLIFGFWLSPVVVIAAACMANRHAKSLNSLVRASPSFAALLVVVFQSLIENGTPEYVIGSDVVRPIASFLAFIALCGALRFGSTARGLS